MMGLIRNSGPPRGARNLLKAYGEVPMLRAVVDKIAMATAAVNFRPFRLPKASILSEKFAGLKSPFLRRECIRKAINSGDLQELQTHPIITMLNRPNPTLTAMQIRQVCQTHLETVGETFIQLAMDKATKTMPLELWPVVPTNVTRLPTFDRKTYGVKTDTFEIEIPPEQMIWMKYVNPEDIYGRGLGLASTLNNELDADEFSSRTIAARFWNNATPELLVSLLGATTDEIKLVREQWMQMLRGGHKTGLPHFTGTDMKVDKLDSTFVDLDIVNLKESLRDWIRELYGVPPEILGIVENSNRATITTAMTIFAINCLIPRLELWQEYFNTRLIPLFGAESNVVLLYDSPIPDDRDFVLELAKAAPYAFTIDELRELSGRRPLVGAGGDLHALPNSTSLVNFNAPEESISTEEPEPEEPEEIESDEDEGESEEPEADEEAEPVAEDEAKGLESNEDSGLEHFGRSLLS